jgi:hypothetical protein
MTFLFAMSSLCPVCGPVNLIMQLDVSVAAPDVGLNSVFPFAATNQLQLFPYAVSYRMRWGPTRRFR